MRLRFLESPLQRRLDSRAEYHRPLSPAQVEDVLHEAAGIARRAAPGDAASCRRELEFLVDRVTAHDGQLTLHGVQRFTRDPWGEPFGRRDHYPDDRVLQRAHAALTDVLVKWANDGRPELAADHKQPLDLAKLRAHVDAGTLLGPEDAQTARALLDALGESGAPISWRRIERIGAELQAAIAANRHESVMRRHAELLPDASAHERLDALRQRSKGAVALGKMLGFFADQGELGQLAAALRPGAARVLGGAL